MSGLCTVFVGDVKFKKVAADCGKFNCVTRNDADDCDILIKLSFLT